ncbi:MAG: cupin domain-containing protein [Acidimicrobiales bacterium]|nr:cupin domain-containing protein [Acidimicrobiales bacterium]
MTQDTEVPPLVAESPIELDTDETVVAVGSRIRKLRSERQLTLQMLSAKTGLSASMLSMVERGRTSPSIGTLVAIASALRVHMSALFDIDDEEQPVEPVHRLDEQPRFETAAGVLRRVAQNDNVRGVELVVNEYLPGTASAAVPVHHSGLEYGIVLEGELTVELEDKTYRLAPGDSIAYDSTTPHRLLNTGSSRASAVWVNLDR